MGQMCSDIERPEITDINVCKEAQEWLHISNFVDQSSYPDPEFPSGCCHWDHLVPSRAAVVWNPVERGTPHEEIKSICLDSGKYILVYHLLSQRPSSKSLT